MNPKVVVLSIRAICTDYITEDASFSILLELRDEEEAPIGTQDETNQDPTPWVPADKQYTTSETSDDAQLHLLRVVETGIVNVSLMTLSLGHSLIGECFSSLLPYRNQKRNSKG